MKNKRAELHTHTIMSVMDGVSEVADYIDFALNENLCAIAVTDHGSVQAFPALYRQAWKLRAAGRDLKLIYGSEIYLSDGGKVYHASLLALNKTGLKNLYKLVSLANTEYFNKIPITPSSELIKYREGLLVGSGCDSGKLYRAAIEGKTAEELAKIAGFFDYIEIVPTENFGYLIGEGGAKTKEDLIAINKMIVGAGEAAGKPVVAVSDAHCASEDDIILRKMLKSYMGFKTDERFIAPRVKTTKEMLEEFAYLGEEKAFETVVENPNMIAGKAEEGFPPFEENAFYSADIEELIDKVNKKLKEKYGENIPPECLERVERELSLLENIEKNVYNLLISSKLVGCAADQGWTVGSRGSVASSFVAYLLGITGINPLEAHYYCPKCHYVEFHNEYYCGADLEDKFCGCGAKLEKDGFTVPYETFFGTEGDREIDIDLNFPAEYQNEAFDRLEKVTGLKTVRCGSIGTVPYKTARAMVSRYCKKEGLTIGKKRMEAMVEKLSQVKMTSGIHPGGVFVIPEGKDIYDYTPIQYPADTREILTTHFDYNALEGLLKVDLLPHDAPSLLKRLEEATGVDPKSIPLDDKETLKLFEERKTSGIPEFDSEFVLKRVMNKKKKYSFDDLIRISGLSHGTNTWTENGEELIAKGREFSDIVSCRDDVTLYLISRGLERKEAFGISERVRKGRGMSPEQYDALLNRGVEKERLDSWNKIKYSFPRAHAAAYVLLAFRIAYYKAHFPQEFEKILKSFH